MVKRLNATNSPLYSFSFNYETNKAPLHTEKEHKTLTVYCTVQCTVGKIEQNSYTVDSHNCH